MIAVGGVTAMSVSKDDMDVTVDAPDLEDDTDENELDEGVGEGERGEGDEGGTRESSVWGTFFADLNPESLARESGVRGRMWILEVQLDLFLACFGGGELNDGGARLVNVLARLRTRTCVSLFSLRPT